MLMLTIKFKSSQFTVLSVFFGTFLILSAYLSSFDSSLFHDALAQADVQTVKYRDLVIDLGDGVTTKAQLSYPAIGEGPFPAVFLIHGSGAVNMNETLTKNTKPFWEISQYLSERGFAVLKYDKRGVGEESYTILDKNVWGNNTVNDQIQDGKKALNVLVNQPEVDPNRISIIGHSEGTLYAPRVAIDNSTNVDNIILMAVLAQNPLKVEYYQDVSLPLEYAMQVLDKNNSGSVSIQDVVMDPLLKNFLLPSSVLYTNDTSAITAALMEEFGNSGHINIDKQLEPFLIKGYENTTAFNSTASNSLSCDTGAMCPILWNSLSNTTTNLSTIGNVSKSIGILILNGENDVQTPVQQAFLLHQRLNEVNHPDHTLITYPELGHAFTPSSKWQTGFGPMEPDVLEDLYSWLESHSR